MKPRRSRNQFDEDQIDDDSPHNTSKPKRTRGKRRKLPWILVLVVVVIALLPVLVAKTPLRNILISAALPTDQLRVTVGGASLGWFTAPALSQVQVRDAAGDTLLTAEAIRMDRTPGNLILNSRDLGVIEIVRPTIYLKIRADGSNLQDALRQALADVASSVEEAPAADSTSQPVAIAVRLVEGTIFAEDATTGRRWRIQGVDLQYDTHGAGGGLGRGKLTGQIADIAADNSVVGSPGQFAVSIQPDGNGKQQLTLQADALSLGLADAWLRQYVAGTELSGTLSGQGTTLWTASGAAFPSDLTTFGTLAIDRLDATAPALAGDHVRLVRVELPWRIAAQPAGLVIEDLQLRSDVGQVAVRGTIDPAAFAIASSNGTAMADAVARHEVELRGSLDLARLATMLPHALRIRSDTTITSGTIQLAARSQPADGGQLLTGSLQTAQLAATSAGRPFSWDQPVSANFALRRQQGLLRLDALQCDSEFLKVDASGTPQQLAATAQFDLNRLAEQLGQFIDLSGVGLAGTGTAKLDWQQTAPDQFSATATGELAQLRIALGEGSISSGRSNVTANIRIAGNAIDVTDCKLVVTDLRATSAGWNINEPRAELAGDAHWNGATGEISADTAQLVTSAVSLAAKDVRYRAPQPNAGQPGVGQLTGMAAFRADVARLAAWRAVPQQTPPYQPSGEITGQARFMQQGNRLTGELTATGQNLALAQWTTANNSVAASRGVPAPGQPDQPGQAGYQTIWQEPQVTIHGLAAYESQTDRLAFEQFQIQSNTLQAAATGQIDNLSTAADAKLNGTLNYDLAQITPLLRPYLGDGIQLVGREQAQFALAGQLGRSSEIQLQSVGFSGQSATRNPQSDIPWSRRVRAQLQVPWSGANVYGLPIGPGKLAATLGDGAIRVEPLALAVGEGQLTAAPNVRLDPPPSELTLPQGPVITNVRISPQVSEAMLKYVAPVLAGATQSEGLFSMVLDGARLPLGEPKRADAAGQLTVHSVRVVPGPMAKQWVDLAQQIESLAKRRDPTAAAGRQQVTLLSVKDQQVNFHVVDGRVHHQNMEFQVGDVTLRSQGSVGFDETVALTLSVPIQDAWVDKEPLLAGLKGQSLQIPISGTLTRPQMDQRAISSLTQQLLQGAAQQAVGCELNKALDKLFKPR